MKILVTGGSGFIGSNLCRNLLNNGEEVICVDNNYSSSKKNIYELLDYKSFEFIRHDITFPLYVEVDQIYHLACPASPIYYQRDPVFTTKTCVHGSINILGLAKRLKCPVLLSSTSEIYGDPEVHPQVETYRGSVNPIGIRACYDEGKRCAETLFFDYYRQHNLKIRVARIFNTYGPGMVINDGRLISNIIVQALKDEDITVYGDGLQTRSFCYVTDTINALIKLMNSDFIGPINIGTSEEISVNGIVDLIKFLTRSKSEIIHTNKPSDDPVRRRPDISLAFDKLHWEPFTDLVEGITRTIDYFKSII